VSTETDGSKVAETCTKLKDAIVQLNGYLEWASNEITSVWINTYLPSRISALNAKIDDCADGCEGSTYSCIPAYIARSDATITYSNMNAGSNLDQVMSPDLSTNGWNAGGFAPQWIQFYFQSATYVKSIRLVVDILPNCNVDANIVATSGTGDQYTVANLSQYMSAGQIIDVDVKAEITSLRITTTSTLSWVAWKRVIFSGAEDCGCH